LIPAFAKPVEHNTVPYFKYQHNVLSPFSPNITVINGNIFLDNSILIWQSYAIGLANISTRDETKSDVAFFSSPTTISRRHAALDAFARSVPAGFREGGNHYLGTTPR
jgi:hypothetical protein